MVLDYGNLKSVLDQEEQARSRLEHQSAFSRNKSPNFFSAWRNQVKQLFARVPQTVTIRDMGINLTAIWKTITTPFRFITRKLIGRAQSRRFSPAQKQLRKIKLIRLGAIGGLAAVVIIVLGFFGLYAWYAKDLPKPGEVVRKSGFSTRIYDREGELLYDLYNTERRIPINIKNIPDYLKHATVAIEDKDFYKHGGFDLLTIIRIPYNIIFRHRVIGGSTLTQQLVKNALLTNERTIIRKYKELILSLQIERRFSKDEILEMYLNEAPYGGTAWGVGAAADMYFKKDVRDLTVVESAFLAGLPQRPSIYSPFAGKEDKDGNPYWQGRTETVLEKMKEYGYLTEIAYQEATTELNSMEFERTVSNIKAPHFVFYIRDQLEEMFGEDVVESGGLQVTTTLDLKLHEKAEEIVQEEVEDIAYLNITNGAAMVMDPDTGEILSMVGSADYFAKEATQEGEVAIGGQFNVAVDGLRQPGSSIKPVTYLAMFQRGHTPASMLMDVETEFMTGIDSTEKPYQPKNYDGKFHGPISLRNALGSSINVPAVKSVAIVGVDNFLQLAYELGFDTLEPTQENLRRFGLAVTLGGGEVHLLDTVTAYSTFANGGRKVQPISILKVQDMNGSVLFEHKQVNGPQVISAGEAFLINHVLSDNNARLLAFGANSLLNTGRPIAVKTGTTNDQRDNWTIGWSQKIMVGTWVGNNDNSPMKQVASGVTGASPIWRRIILAALEEGYGAPEWVAPEGVEQVQVDSLSGYPSHNSFPEKTEYVLRGTLPSLPDPIHTKLKLCRGEDKLANDARIAAGDYDEREYIVIQVDDPVSQDGKNRWQEAINAWIEAQNDSRYKPPTESCGEASDVFVEMKKPENEKKYETEDIEVVVRAESGEGIEKIEIIVNGEVRETVNDREYKGKLNLFKGRYEVWAKAYSRGDKSKETNKVKIGTGGENWKEPAPSPSPTKEATQSSDATPSAGTIQ
ncbi:transglycosylase domain-containing protein [Patescibacteria group bacterium]|nr:transglycosylase domain-containing protein [Patescibacteria group bacterium]MBU1967123.1 transglycosylase domain-containing protein [Patescibacteria group bacterium]